MSDLNCSCNTTVELGVGKEKMKRGMLYKRPAGRVAKCCTILEDHLISIGSGILVLGSLRKRGQEL